MQVEREEEKCEEVRKSTKDKERNEVRNRRRKRWRKGKSEKQKRCFGLSPAALIDELAD